MMKAGLGISPQVDKTALYIQIPKLTREHRESLSKNATLIYHETISKLQNTFNKNTKKVSTLKGISIDTIMAIKEQVIIFHVI
jgi:ribosome recycling factor